MKRRLVHLFAVVAVLTASVCPVEGGKPTGGGGGGGTPTPTGTIFYTNSLGFWAMNADGTGKTPVFMPIPAGHRLNPDSAEAAYGYGMPSDLVYGSDPKLDRWYLVMVHTRSYDKVIYPSGAVRTANTTTYPDGRVVASDPQALYQYEMFAYRTDPADRSTVVAVQITDFFGLGWCQLNGLYAYWSNDNNESADSFVGSAFYDIRTCFHVDDDGNNVIDFTLDPDKFGNGSGSAMVNYQLPLKGSDLQAAYVLGEDLNLRPTVPEDLDQILVAAWPELSRSQDGLNYTISENDKLVIRRVIDNSLVKVVWNGTAGVQPKYPGSAIWSRDGATILFKNEGNASYTSSGGYWKIPITGGTPTQLVGEAYKAWKWTSYHNGLWSPDSQFISVTYLLDDRSRATRVVTKDVKRMLSTGGTLTNLTSDDSTPATGYRWVSNSIAP